METLNSTSPPLDYCQIALNKDKILTKPNKRFKPILNCGGSSGFHLHLFGVYVTKPQHRLANALLLSRENRPSFSLIWTEVDPLESPLKAALFWPSSKREVESGVLPGSGMFPSLVMTGMKERSFRVGVGVGVGAMALASRARYETSGMGGREGKRESHRARHGAHDQATGVVRSPISAVTA
jgi:hypothetical protein